MPPHETVPIRLLLVDDHEVVRVGLRTLFGSIKTIQVVGPRDAVVVYRGIDRESYSCTPTCERRITLGDAPAYFDATLNQAGSRAGQAMGGGQAPQPQR